jgi:hypothetical protein
MKNQKSGKDKMKFIHEMRNFGLMLQGFLYMESGKDKIRMQRRLQQ